MERNDVRTRILSEHAQLRELLDELVGYIESFAYGSDEIGADLRARGIAFFEVFASHISLEDEMLVPALRELGEMGHRLAERLAHEHQEQRELIRYLLTRLEHDDRPSLVVAQELRNFSEYVRQDMAHEEETILREDLLRG